MTAPSSASWSRFSAPSYCVNGHVSTMWFVVCRWPQSQEGDWVRPQKNDGVIARQWQQLDHMQTVCTSLQTDNHTNTSSPSFYRPDALSDAQPTVSKHWRQVYDNAVSFPCSVSRDNTHHQSAYSPSHSDSYARCTLFSNVIIQMTHGGEWDMEIWWTEVENVARGRRFEGSLLLVICVSHFVALTQRPFRL